MKSLTIWFLSLLAAAIAIALLIGYFAGRVAGGSFGFLLIALFIILAIALRFDNADRSTGLATEVLIVASFNGIAGVIWMVISAFVFAFRSEWFGGDLSLQVVISFGAPLLGGTAALIQYRLQPMNRNKRNIDP